MKRLQVVVECSSMLISTQFFRFAKAVEHFYYALLFSSEDYASSGADAWNSWLAQGFHIAVREAPPAVRKPDRVTVDSVPGRNFEIMAASENDRVVGRLGELLGEIERARVSLDGIGTEAKVDGILEAGAIVGGLLTPVRESLKRSAVTGKNADAVLAMIRQGISALSNWQIKSIKVSVH
jgi:hypothetical protein